MSSRFLLDTSTISEPMKKASDEAMVAKIEAQAHESALAAPVWHEFWYGCRRLPSGKRRSALEAYLREVVYASFPILPYDAVAAAWHAEEHARLEGEGTPAPFVDGQIAAIAKVRAPAVSVRRPHVSKFRPPNALRLSRAVQRRRLLPLVEQLARQFASKPAYLGPRFLPTKQSFHTVDHSTGSR